MADLIVSQQTWASPRHSGLLVADLVPERRKKARVCSRQKCDKLLYNLKTTASSCTDTAGSISAVANTLQQVSNDGDGMIFHQHRTGEAVKDPNG